MLYEYECMQCRVCSVCSNIRNARAQESNIQRDLLFVLASTIFFLSLLCVLVIFQLHSRNSFFVLFFILFSSVSLHHCGLCARVCMLALASFSLFRFEYVSKCVLCSADNSQRPTLMVSISIAFASSSSFL